MKNDNNNTFDDNEREHGQNLYQDQIFWRNSR